jgi:cytochrome c556
MKAFVLVAPLACLALVACGPQSPGAKAAQERHAHFHVIGAAFKAIGDELKKTSPDLATIRENAATIDSAASQLKSWFPKGSGPQDGIRTHALALVWSQPDEFGEKAAKLTDAADALNTAAKAGDLAAVRGAVPPVGEACKGCHDRFREKDAD